MRTDAREVVFKYIFSQLFNPSDEGLFTILAKDAKLSEDEFSFANDLLTFVQSNKDKYLDIIENLSIGFKLNRMFEADKCALILGMAELENYPQTDLPIIIDEAVKLVAKFSAERSTDFVNGILAEYSKIIGRN